jgi:hypothetical protein
MIIYTQGDATRPVGGGPRCLMHIVNSVGGWGRGFVVAISNRWPEPEAAYRQWHRTGMDVHPFELGQTQRVTVAGGIQVFNMLAQEGYGANNRNLHRSEEPDAKPPIRYDALLKCLKQVSSYAVNFGATVHAPRIGCGLAGGKWPEIEPLIQAAFPDQIPVYIYDYEPNK